MLLGRPRDLGADRTFYGFRRCKLFLPVDFFVDIEVVPRDAQLRKQYHFSAFFRSGCGIAGHLFQIALLVPGCGVKIDHCEIDYVPVITHLPTLPDNEKGNTSSSITLLPANHSN